MTVRIASLNLNKRLRNRSEDLLTWATSWDADLLVVQEPWSGNRPWEGSSLGSLKFLGGNEFVAAYGRTGLAKHFRFNLPRHLTVELDGLRIDNVYFEASRPDAGKRRDFLDRLSAEFRSHEGPALIVGDFNLAPSDEDGLWAGSPAKWTTNYERVALAGLLARGFADLGAGSGEFTIEREQRGKISQFRCDLAIYRGSQEATLSHSHATRRGQTAFTDHSGLLVEINL